MLQHKNSQLHLYLALLGGLSFMCFSAIFIKSAHAPGIITTFYRMAIACIVLLPIFLINRHKYKHKLPARGVLLAILSGICFGGDMAFWSTAVVGSNATIPTITANLAPVWVGIGAILIFKEKHNTLFWLGILLAIGGIILMVSHDLTLSNGILKGAILGLCAGIFYGIFYLLSQQGRKLLNTISFLFISTFSSAVFLFIAALIFKYPFFGYDKHTLLMFLGIGLGVQVCGWMLISYAQGFLPATIVAPTLLGQPVLVGILAVLLLHEQLKLSHLIGGIIVIAGIYLVHFSRK